MRPSGTLGKQVGVVCMYVCMYVCRVEINIQVSDILIFRCLEFCVHTHHLQYKPFQVVTSMIVYYYIVQVLSSI